MYLNKNQIQAVDKSVCRSKGLDPDARVTKPATPNARGITLASISYCSQWELFVEQIENFVAISDAINRLGLETLD